MQWRTGRLAEPRLSARSQVTGAVRADDAAAACDNAGAIVGCLAAGDDAVLQFNATFQIVDCIAVVLRRIVIHHRHMCQCDVAEINVERAAASSAIAVECAVGNVDTTVVNLECASKATCRIARKTAVADADRTALRLYCAAQYVGCIQLNVAVANSRAGACRRRRNSAALFGRVSKECYAVSGQARVFPQEESRRHPLPLCR